MWSRERGTSPIQPKLNPWGGYSPSIFDPNEVREVNAMISLRSGKKLQTLWVKMMWICAILYLLLLPFLKNVFPMMCLLLHLISFFLRMQTLHPLRLVLLLYLWFLSPFPPCLSDLKGRSPNLMLLRQGRPSPKSRSTFSSLMFFNKCPTILVFLQSYALPSRRLMFPREPFWSLM